ncbi:hypothetical protein [Runella sp.]|uniref:hypothetical protein n=1 Tax=Runella sp. TaxID=1960881 RepID=UPI003D0D6452
MNFFKIKTTWSNAEFIPLKLCIAAAYLLLGAYFHDFFITYFIPVLVVFVITVIWTVYLWTDYKNYFALDCLTPSGVKQSNFKQGFS